MNPISPLSQHFGNQSTGEGVPPLRSLTNLLAVESLFTLAGGYMDAYAYLAHGHVFANAQTGNVVLLAISAAQGNWTQAGRHLPPILACSLGVATAKLLGAKSSKHTFHATLICQTVELTVVALLAIFGSSFLSLMVVPALSFVAALQITSFDTLGPWSFNSAITTGNLKSATVGIVLWLKGENPRENRGKAFVAANACLSFLVGALFGGVYTAKRLEHALAPCTALLLVGNLLIWRQRAGNHKLVRDRNLC